MIEITIPAIGVAMTEATVLEWLKQPGDPVAADEVVLEIETDKAMTELTSPVAGRLGRQLAAAGETIPVGTVVARVLEGDEEEPDDVPAAEAPAEAAEEPGAAAEPAAPAAEAAAPRRLSPRERRLAAEQAGSADAPAAAPPADRFRELIAAKTLEAWQTIPHFGVSRQLDAEPLQAALAAARAQHDGPADARPTITDLLLVALAQALAVTGDDGDVALAVATPRGVANPVIPNVRALTLADVAAARAAAVGRAREGRLEERDLGAATTTLSNLGTAAVDRFTGIVTPGQRTLLTVGSIAVRPWVADGTLTARATLDATVNADHRALDGADAAALLTAFADALAALAPAEGAAA